MERGGATTQAGVYYQNSVAAAYLARLCDAQQRGGTENPVAVRCETLDAVDDVVVTYADGRRRYIQAKAEISRGSAEWRKLWLDLASQYLDAAFVRDTDMLALAVGMPRPEHQHLKGACERAKNSPDVREWQQRITGEQRALIDGVQPILPAELQDEDGLFRFLSRIEVDIWPLELIEALACAWMPPSDHDPSTVLQLLRDRVCQLAGVRGSFTGEALRHSLLNQDSVRFEAPVPLEVLRSAAGAAGAWLRTYRNTFARPTGAEPIHLQRPVVKEILSWACGEGEPNLALLLDDAGMGKSVVMRDVLEGLEQEAVCTLGIKCDDQLAGVASSDELRDRLDLPEPAERVVARLAEAGGAVVIIDQVDALSLSMARDQRALEVVLGLVARVRCIPRARVLLTCRCFDLHNDPRLNRLDAGRRFTLPLLTPEEVNRVLQACALDSARLSGATLELLRTPLHLHVFLHARGPVASGADGPKTIQDLYCHLWTRVVERRVQNDVTPSARIRALNLLVEYMDSHQTTAAPHELLDAAGNDVVAAADFLASEGVLIRGAARWSLLHQTFFDYCYARRFVASEQTLSQSILSGSQGLFVRPQVIHVLAYLRSCAPDRYAQELRALLDSPELRPHLRELVLRWLGDSREPNDAEWTLARRMLAGDEKDRRDFYRLAWGNAGWLPRLKDTLVQDLSSEDRLTIEGEALPYLASIADSAQEEVVRLIRPFLDRGDLWCRRIAGVINSVRHWRTAEASDLLVDVFQRLEETRIRDLLFLQEIAAVAPDAFCRMLRIALDRVVENISKEPYCGAREIGQELAELDGGMVHEAVENVIANSPAALLAHLLPWLEQVVTLTCDSDQRSQWLLARDGLSSEFGLYHQPQLLLSSLARALTALAESDPATCAQYRQRLAALPIETPQRLLLELYRTAPHLLAEEAAWFLRSDHRRLSHQIGTYIPAAGVVAAIYPYLPAEGRQSLKRAILSLESLRAIPGPAGLRWRGYTTYALLRAVPEGHLSALARHKLLELMRKFPEVSIPDRPNKMVVGSVQSPISEDRVLRMSDTAWLRAMRKHDGRRMSASPWVGSAYELAALLQRRAQAEPERFYRLALGRVPKDVHHAYLTALIHGLSGSNLDECSLFETILHFLPGADPNYQDAAVWILREKASATLPDGLVDFLDKYVKGAASTVGTDRDGWDTSTPRDPHDRLPYSTRRVALAALVRCLKARGTDPDTRHMWEVLDQACSSRSSGLRAGAIEGLLYTLASDGNRSVALFASLLQGHPALLDAGVTQQFLYHSIAEYGAQIRPFVRQLMNSREEVSQRRGAEIAAAEVISVPTKTADSDNAGALEDLITGPACWRRGAAAVFAYNVAGSAADLCFSSLARLMNDEDPDVRIAVADAFRYMRDRHINSRRGFIRAFAESRSLREGYGDFMQFMKAHSLLDPDFTIEVVSIALGNPAITQHDPPFFAGDLLVRLVLGVYTASVTEESTRRAAMMVFDRLTGIYSAETHVALGEWDRR